MSFVAVVDVREVEGLVAVRRGFLPACWDDDCTRDAEERPGAVRGAIVDLCLDNRRWTAKERENYPSV